MIINNRQRELARAKQIFKLINEDFPWLWAIKNFWDTDFNNITVVNADKGGGFDKFLSSLPADNKVWIYYRTRARGQTFFSFGIKNVQPHSSTSWGTAIIQELSGMDEILAIAVGKKRLAAQGGMGAITIYRFKKSQSSPFKTNR